MSPLHLLSPEIVTERGKHLRQRFLFLFALLTFFEMSWHFGLNIEYRFEVAIVRIV